jgi:glycosyltransferase involved in cell wall biosynthesis
MISAPMKVSVVCPFFNEEAIIERAVARTVGNLSRQFSDWELILVNDGSTDRSLALVLEAIARTPAPVRVISCDRNQGRGRALKNGIDAASGEVIVTTEVDCSWGDDIAFRLVDALNATRAHVVVASPHMAGGKLVNVPAARIFLSTIGNLFINAFFSSGVSMSTGMTRAYRREVIQPLVVTENGKEFHLEVLLKLRSLGFDIREIPATLEWQDHRLNRARHSHRRSSTRVWKTIATHLRFVAVAQPMSYFAVVAGLSVLAGLGFIAVAFRNLMVGQPAAFLAIVGLILLVLALMFAGFSVLFIAARDIQRELWMRHYAGTLPPSRLDAVEIEQREVAGRGR